MPELSPLRWSRVLAMAGIAILITIALVALSIFTRPLSAPAEIVAPTAKSAAPPPRSPFIGIDTSALSESERSAISRAEADFLRTLRGLPPLCKLEPDSGFSDGGTVIYECKDYKLTVMRQIFILHGVIGCLYGPVLTFPNGQTISDVRFYTDRELSLLLNDPAMGGI